MSLSKHKHALVFISAGVGDAILLVPLINALKKDGFLVTGLFTSPYQCEAMFENVHLFDFKKVALHKSILLLYALSHYKKYDFVFLNHFAFSRSHFIVSKLMGKKLYTNYKDLELHKTSNAVHFVKPKTGIHDALQHLHLYQPEATLQDLDFNVRFNPKSIQQYQLPQRYIVVQPSSANNKAPFKNWPFENWLKLFHQISNTTIVVLGDQSEINMHHAISEQKFQHVISLIGKTNLSEVMNLLYHAHAYVGLDSGLMHIAMLFNKPTFTIWGASNPIQYGYNWLHSKHHVQSLNLSCAPCSSWIGANQQRVKSPNDCPDFKCIRDITVDDVLKELTHFLKVNLPS